MDTDATIPHLQSEMHTETAVVLQQEMVVLAPKNRGVDPESWSARSEANLTCHLKSNRLPAVMEPTPYFELAEHALRRPGRYSMLPSRSR
jgi:hypothetical protein